MPDADKGSNVTDQDEQNLPRRPAGITFHLTPEDVWSAQHQSETYVPAAFAHEGFIHCTDGEAQVLEAGNRYYRDDPRPYVLLDIELERTGSPAIYEDAGCLYPHVYGPIASEAVVRARRVVRAADGSFTAIGDALPCEVP